MVKPDLAIYRLHADTFGLDPGATLFFDDSAKNVEGARGAGWNAELFTSAWKRCATTSRAHGSRRSSLIDVSSPGVSCGIVAPSVSSGIRRRTPDPGPASATGDTRPF